MLCSSCGHENREGKRFCVECGTALARRCPTCRAEVEAGEKFCGECGTALAPAPGPAPIPAPSAVRKTVTVLFADLGGSTGFGERTEAEIARQVLARYHALLQETIDTHAGTVAKFMGDGMMATFGIPEVAEDDARRAVAAGTDLQQRFVEFANVVERRHGERLTLRVGINTGEVVIGEGDADLIGDALNVAARLEKACRPGHVLVGEETWRLTRSDVAYEALGDVTVAGRAQPVAVFEVATDSTGGAEEAAAPFVGRDPEIARLLAVLDDARATAAGRLATVVGSPGVGKTRLARELCARADAQSVELRCDRAGEATFAPVAQLIRESAGLIDDADADAARAAIGTLLPESEADRARIVDGLAGLVGAAPARSVEETFWAVRRLVETTAVARPLVVVIDDIQWAEPLLLDLIEHLAEWVRGAAVLLLALARPELREVRPALAEPGRPVADVVVLDGLDAAATQALAAGLLGTDRLPAGLVERLPASTDGNPLFVRELVRMLVDDQVIRRRDDGTWELTIDADAVDVPPTIQSLLGARVERLPATERELLELASVVGAEFSHGALRELAGDRTPVVPLLETMRRKELVEPTGTYWGDEPVYRFHHVLIRDAAYRRLLKTTRAELHERVAEWTDRTAADLIGEHEAAIAFHYEQAHGYRVELGALDTRTDELARRGAELLTTAARRALGRDDLASAGALSARALALLPESDTAARADLLTMGCESLLASGNGAAARPLVEELARVAAGDDRLGAWADCFAAQLVGLTDPDGIVAADAQVAAAAETLTALEDGSGQAKAHQVRAGLLARLGRVGDCELELDLALAAARGADDRRRVTAVLGAAPDAALFGPSPVARAGGRCLDVVRLLRITTASPAVEAASNRCQAVLESLRGRFDVSRSMLTSARSSLEELGLRHGLAHTDLYAGMIELIAGDPTAAIPPLRAAFGGLGALGVGADAGTAAALLARALLVDGEVEEADQMAAASENLAGQNLQTAIGWRVARAEVRAARGDLIGAVALAEQAVEIAAGTDLVIDHAEACVALAALRARAGDAAGARLARSEAKRLYEQKGATVPAARLDESAVVTPQPAPVEARPVAGAVTVGADAPPLSNSATDLAARMVELYLAGRFEECGRLYAEDAVTEDRRSIIGADLVGRAAHAANFEITAALGSRPTSYETIAIRGSTLELGRLTMGFSDWEGRFLSLTEVGPDGLIAHAAWFDEDALDAAMDELDAWYLAGEAAEQAELVVLNTRWSRAINTFDWDAMRELAEPEFRFVDRRRIHIGTVDLDGFFAWWRQYEEIGEFDDIVVDLRVRGRAILVTSMFRVVDGDGAEMVWSMHTVGARGSTGRTELIEVFDESDWDTARARFDELSAHAPLLEPHTLENAASRVHAQVIHIIASRRDEELVPLLAPGFRYDDRRSVVNMGDNDLAAAAAHLAQLREAQYEWRTPTTIAVRGERLALARSVFRTGAGDDTSSLVLVEIDARERLLSITQLDDDALDAAINELDARYAATDGAAHADLMRLVSSWIGVFEHGDVDRIQDLVAPDFVWVDHQQLGWGTLDVAQIVELFKHLPGVRNSVVVSRALVSGHAILFSAANHATDAAGGEVLWSFHSVGTIDDRGRTTRVEIFAERDLAGALARLDELGGRGSRPPLENTASRVDAEALALSTSGAHHELTALVSPDFHLDDRRRVVNFGEVDLTGAASHIEWLRGEGNEWSVPQVVAVRGDRLVLSRRNRRTRTGDDLPSLAVVEVDEQGRLLALVQFDAEALDDAVAELDARYLALARFDELAAENSRLEQPEDETP